MPGHALVLEGGGMKAAYANGVLSAFEEAGHRGFDAVYGTSAGGALAAWWGSGQVRQAELTWAYAADRRILSYRRWLTARGPILDHEFLWEVVYRDEVPLDVEALRASPVPIVVCASDVDDGKPAYADIRQGQTWLWLKATGRLPFASGTPVPIRGRRYLDGGITDPIPVRKAALDGHSTLTLVLNTPAGPRRRDIAALARLTARRYPALRDGILRHRAIKQEAIAWAESPPPGVTVRIVRPRRPTGLHRLSRDLGAIRAGIHQGRLDGHLHVEQLRREAGQA